MALSPAGAYRRCSACALRAASRSWSSLIAATLAETASAGAAAWVAVAAAAGPCAVVASSFLHPAKAHNTARPATSRNGVACKGFTDIENTPLTVRRTVARMLRTRQEGAFVNSRARGERGGRYLPMQNDAKM